MVLLIINCILFLLGFTAAPECIIYCICKIINSISAFGAPTLGFKLALVVVTGEVERPADRLNQMLYDGSGFHLR